MTKRYELVNPKGHKAGTHDSLPHALIWAEQLGYRVFDHVECEYVEVGSYE